MQIAAHNGLYDLGPLESECVSAGRTGTHATGNPAVTASDGPSWSRHDVPKPERVGGTGGAPAHLASFCSSTVLHVCTVLLLQKRIVARRRVTCAQHRRGSGSTGRHWQARRPRPRPPPCIRPADPGVACARRRRASRPRSPKPANSKSHSHDHDRSLVRTPAPLAPCALGLFACRCSRPEAPARLLPLGLGWELLD